MKITIIGAGVMGTVFLEALRKNSDYKITITDNDVDKLKVIKEKYSDVQILENNEAIKNADVILLAVKPQSFSKFAEEVKGKINEAVIISIMAGIKMEKIKNELCIEKIVRAMPNLGARVGCSMTVWTENGLVEKEKKKIKEIMCLIGEEIFTDNEDKIDLATAVSGSGPGFYYYFLEEWIKAVEELGFTKEEAEKMILTTAKGAGMLIVDGKHPEELRKQVTSQGGTTAAGLEVMGKTEIVKIMREVMCAAARRARELSA